MSDGDPNLYAYLMLWEEELVLDGEDVEGDDRRRARRWYHRRHYGGLRHRGVRRCSTFGRGALR